MEQLQGRGVAAGLGLWSRAVWSRDAEQGYGAGLCGAGMWNRAVEQGCSVGLLNAVECVEQGYGARTVEQSCGRRWSRPTPQPCSRCTGSTHGSLLHNSTPQPRSTQGSLWGPTPQPCSCSTAVAATRPHLVSNTKKLIFVVSTWHCRI